MEIERKFLIDEFPGDLPLIKEAEVFQGYLSVDPVVRIRSSRTALGTGYVLCFKGNGTLARQETEIDIDEKTFGELENLLKAPMIRKDYKVYALPDGHKLECSLVDQDTPTSFLFAEVEFETIEEAQAWCPPAFLSREVTEDRSYGMAGYWVRKAAAWASANPVSSGEAR